MNRISAPSPIRRITRSRAVYIWTSVGTAFGAGLWLGVILAVFALGVR